MPQLKAKLWVPLLTSSFNFVSCQALVKFYHYKGQDNPLKQWE